VTEVARPNPEVFQPIDPDADLGPAQVDRFLKQLYNELAFARLRLRQSRYDEVNALKAFSEREMELKFSDECPQVSRSTGVSRADQEAWIVSQASALYWAHQSAKVMRENAEDYSRQVRDQVKCIQSIGANARQAYDLSGRT
jgi:hypothetical protein